MIWRIVGLIGVIRIIVDIKIEIKKYNDLLLTSKIDSNFLKSFICIKKYYESNFLILYFQNHR